MKRMAVIFNSDYQNWPMGGMISYITQTVQMLSDTFEIELWGCSVNGEKPEFVQIGELCYPISVCANAKTGRKLIPNVARCFFGTLVNSGSFCADRYDILYFHLSASHLGWYFGQMFHNRVSDGEKKPLVILQQHGMAYRNRVGDALNYFAMERSDLVFFTTDPQSLVLHKSKLKNPNVVRMPSMIDTDFFSPVSPDEKIALRSAAGIDPDEAVFIYTGRITDWKNPLLLLDAFRVFRNSNGGRGYLIYVGDGELLSSLEQKIQEWNLSDAVKLAGRQSRKVLRDYLRMSDVFLLPSRGEGVSVASLEAMSTNLPVVAFRVEGMEGFLDESSGVLVDDQNAFSFAAGMEQGIRGNFSPRVVAMEYSVDNVKRYMVQQIFDGLKMKRKLTC